MKKIAVTSENGQIFQHFGVCKEFAVYSCEDGEIVEKNLLDASGSGHSALALLLHQQGVDTLICGGIGQGAIDALAKAGVELVYGIQGSVEEAVQKYLSGALASDPASLCNHHHGDHEGHSCGHHHQEGHSHACHCGEHE